MLHKEAPAVKQEVQWLNFNHLIICGVQPFGLDSLDTDGLV